MSITWVTSAAFAGFAFVALPIAIHLLVRQQTRVVAFPSLRFLSATAQAAFRRRAIQDTLLLVCRVAILAVAVLALAGPIVHTASRTRSYANRLSRAIVLLEAPREGDDSLAQGAFRSATFQRANTVDALMDAVRWLDAQTPSAREVVIAGGVRRGNIEPSDLLVVPKAIGVRFVPSTLDAAPNPTTIATLTRRDGRIIRLEHQVQLDADATRVSTENAVEVPAGSKDPAPRAPLEHIRVIAATEDQPLADAALHAALDAGIRWTTTDRRVIVVWEGAGNAPPPTPGIEVIRMPVPAPPGTAATAMWNALDRATPRQVIEPVTITPETLESWSRPPGSPSSTAVPADEGDRRWLWAAALVLLAAEHWLRRDRLRAADSEQERRVA